MSDDLRKIELAETASLLTTATGRKVIWRMLMVTGFFADAFDSDPYLSARNAGGRQVGVWLWNELNEAAPERVTEMMKENAHG